MQWDNSLSSASPIIDTHHQVIIGRANKLLQGFQQDTAERREVSTIIQYLTEYVVSHFWTEEKHMTDIPA
jgi:hemerythrin